MKEEKENNEEVENEKEEETEVKGITHFFLAPLKEKNTPGLPP